MAIFGPKDGGLPLLTQFYQLEFDPVNPVGSELDEWAALVKFRLNRPKMDRMGEDGKDYRFATSYGGIWEQDVLRSAPFYPLARRTMDIMADGDDSLFDPAENPKVGWRLRPVGGHGAIPNDEWLRLPEPESGVWDTSEFVLEDCITLLNSDRFGGTLRPLMGHMNPHNPRYDSRKPLVLGYGHVDDEPRIDTGLIAELFEALARGRDAFRRCPTCDSVFIVGRRSDQFRCSRRCNEREATRRRYKKIKSARLEEVGVFA